MLAPAKINLDLKILGRRSDGFHELDSTVVFASLGDHLALTDQVGRLDIDGSFAVGLGSASDNLVVRAANALAEKVGQSIDVGFHLTKCLPSAAGLGGGSSDAATALLLLSRRWNVDPHTVGVTEIAAKLGADIPVCLIRRPTRMRGIGEKTSVLGQADRARLSGTSLLLVNPRQPASTAAVFTALSQMGDRKGARVTDDSRLLHNDLIIPALTVAPAIGDVLKAMSALEKPYAFGMSGSGPSCFALFERMADCRSATARLSAENPHWWVAASRLL